MTEAVHIGALTSQIVNSIPSTKLIEFAKSAREAAEDYRRMAAEHQKQASYFTKCANDRDADADWYEHRASQRNSTAEAAE